MPQSSFLEDIVYGYVRFILCRCIKSFIVNKTKIEKVDLKEILVYLNNGEICYASARLIKGLVK